MPDEPACRFTVPIPPSANNLFPSGAHRMGGGERHRLKAAAYKDWLRDAGWEIKGQRAVTVAPMTGLLRVLIEAPLHRRRDLDNALKPLLDLLGCGKNGMRIIVDDSLIDDLRIVRTRTGDKVTISIWPM